MTKQKPFILLLLIVSLFTIAACSNGEDSNNYEVVATSFSAYDLAVNITGDNKTVKLIMPPGVDLHDYAPSSNDMKLILNSKIFIYTSNELEPWAPNINHKNKINLSEYINTNYELADSVHYWTDTLVHIDLLDDVYDHLILLNTENTTIYHTNYINYKKKLLLLHEELLTYTSNLNINNNKIYFYGHNAVSNFEKLYNLEIIPISTSSTSSGEYTPREVENLITAMKENNAKYLFTEELADLRRPTSLIESLNNSGYQVSLLELHGYHNVSLDDFMKGESYATLLRRNIEYIKTATAN